MSWLWHLLASSVAFYVGAQLLRGVEISGFGRAVLLAAVFGLLNATLGRLLDFLATPINWLTFGLFHLVVDALLIMLADWLLKGVRVRSFWWAFALATVVVVVNSLLFWTF